MSSSKISIKQATENDLRDILDIYNDAILNTTAVYDYKPHTFEMRKAWFDGKMKYGFPVFVAKLDEQTVGFSSYGHFRAWAAYKYTVESSVYVSPEHRGNKIGSQLLPPLIESARANNLHALMAGIDANNSISVHLHKKFGYSEVGKFPQVGYKFGKWLDLLFLQLLLDTPTQPVEE